MENRERSAIGGLIGFILALGLIVPAALADQPLRIVTWNIETVGAPGEPQYAAALAVLDRLGADLVALQEVNGRDDVDFAEDLAFDLGYLYVAISPQSAYDGLRTALFSDYPILASDAWTSVELSGDALANDLTRDPFAVSVDLPGDAPTLHLILSHLKAGSGNDDEFRRAIESYRLTQVTDTFAIDAPFIILGDLNADLGDDPLTPDEFTELPSGLPLSFETGADIDFMLATTGLLNDPFAWLGSVAQVLPALQLDGIDATRPESGRALDYLLLSPEIDATLAQTQIYDCADEGLPGSLPLVGAPLDAETCALAADHLPVFADLVIGSILSGDECSTGALTVANLTLNSGRHRYRSEQGISVEGGVRVGAGAELLLSAPSIALKPGLSVLAGGTLRASAVSVICAQAAAARKTLTLPTSIPSASSTGQSAPQPPTLIVNTTGFPDGVQAQLNALGIDLDAIASSLLDSVGHWLVIETTQALQTNDQNTTSDIYRLDLLSERLQLISVTEQGHAGNGPSRYPTADTSGKRIVFHSDADNLVPNDANGVSDLFLHDVALGQTLRLTHSEQASANPTLDASGERLVYDQDSASGHRQVLAQPLLGDGQVEALSLAEGLQDTALDNHHPGISADGRFVSYLEHSAVSDDLNPDCQVHLYDRATEVYHRQVCPPDIASPSRVVRPAFTPEAEAIHWHLPNHAEPIVVTNPLR
ncbi:endonuclease/exonuclease/phosphatase family protein [Lamprobacter modestohalophilus]|uniref:endonuclease/exonuclease/phosphatase family protein n=1 Tax=Lamprobacter modestohalophilus TaxID=1064514 RepID=UPI002ADEA91D|nr:endonuclease/exonuclease/phosphatase family protein [Lamprobacter modestohalophilus]MEA1052903.1 endonuclease/exonuclease/phosphatase family protein [Lamprobacter modestohalophilus]